jgi:hypothetical protein
VVDNLGSHRNPRIRLAIEACGGSLVFLPKYSPDLNPIEMAFSKLKALLRKAAERSTEALWNRIGLIICGFTPDECANSFTAAGYGATWTDSALELCGRSATSYKLRRNDSLIRSESVQAPQNHPKTQPQAAKTHLQRISGIIGAIMQGSP